MENMGSALDFFLTWVQFRIAVERLGYSQMSFLKKKEIWGKENKKGAKS